MEIDKEKSVRMKNKYYSYFIILIFIFLCSFVGFLVILNIIGFIIKLGEYSFKEAIELTKYLFFCCAVISPLILFSMIITKRK